MDDIFVERLVEKKVTKADTFKKVLIITVALFICMVCFLVEALFTFFHIIVAALCAIIWFVFSKMSIEYEYSLSHGDLTIDIIYAKRSRKNVYEINLKDRLEYLAPNTQDHGGEFNRQAVRTIDVSADSAGDDVYFMNVSSDKGLVRVLFDPNEKLLVAMRKCAPSKTHLK